MADKYREITRVILKDLLKSDIEASALVSTEGEILIIMGKNTPRNRKNAFSS